MIDFLKKHKILIGINAYLIFMYSITIYLHEAYDVDEILMSSYDSKSYIGIGNYFFGNGAPSHVTVRPFLYPFVVKLLSFLGLKAIWVFQFLLWVLSGNFIYLSIYNLTKKRHFSIFGLVVFSFNFSIIMLTLHILSETATVFLMSYLIYYISKQPLQFNLNKVLYIIFFLSLLTVVRPAFYYLFLISLLFLVLYIKQFRFKHIKLLLLVCFPVFIQLTIVKMHSNKFTISTVGFHTFKDYYYSRAYGKVNDLSWNEARKIAYKHDSKEIIKNISKNKFSYVNSFFENIQQNIKSHPIFLTSPKEYKKSNFLLPIMTKQNEIFYFVHLIFLLFLIVTLFFKGNSNKKTTVFLFIIVLFVFTTSGVSFFQGDRLVVIAVPVWVSLYVFITHLISQRLFLYLKK